MSDRSLLIFSDCNENTDPLDRDSGLNRKRAHTDATVDSTSQLSNESPKVPIVTNQTAFYKVWQYPMFGKFLNKKIKKGAICTSNLFTNRTNL